MDLPYPTAAESRRDFTPSGPDITRNFFRTLAVLVGLLGLVVAFFIIASDYSVREAKLTEAEGKMERAWQDMPYSRDAGERFVDGWRSQQLAKDTPWWATGLQKTIWVIATLVAFGLGVLVLLCASGDIER